MKKFVLVTGIIVVALTLPLTMSAGVQKYLWSHSGGGLTELTSVQPGRRSEGPGAEVFVEHSGGGLDRTNQCAACRRSEGPGAEVFVEPFPAAG